MKQAPLVRGSNRAKMEEIRAANDGSAVRRDGDGAADGWDGLQASS